MNWPTANESRSLASLGGSGGPRVGGPRLNVGGGGRVRRNRLAAQQQREQLLDAGAALFAEKPYEDVWMEDIAARVGVSRGTLYHYFPNKRDLYLAIFRRASSRFLARVGPDPQLSIAEQLAVGLESHLLSIIL